MYGLWKKVRFFVWFAFFFTLSGCDKFGMAMLNPPVFQGIESFEILGESKIIAKWSSFPELDQISFAVEYTEIDADRLAELEKEENIYLVSMNKLTDAFSHDPEKWSEYTTTADESIELQLADFPDDSTVLIRVRPIEKGITITESANYIFLDSRKLNNTLENLKSDNSKILEFSGISSVELFENNVLITWPNTFIEEGNDRFVYRVYQGRRFDQLIYETSELSASIELTESILEDPYFGVKVYRYDSLSEDENNKILRLQEIVFSGLKDAKISEDFTKIFLEWEPALNASENVEYLVFNDKDLITQISATSDLSFTFNIPMQGKSYFFGVRARDNGRLDKNHKILEVYIPDMSDKTPPVFKGITSADAVSQDTVIVRWESSPSEDISSYLIYSAEDLTNPISVASKEATEKSIFDLSKGKTYDFIVRASDINGNIDKNDVIKSVTTLNLEVPKFFGLSNVMPRNGVKGLNEFTLEWSHPSWLLPEPSGNENSVGFYLYVSEEQSAYSSLETISNKKPIFIPLSELEGKTRFNYSPTGPRCNQENNTCKKYCFLLRAVDRRHSPERLEYNSSIKCSGLDTFQEPTFEGLSQLSVPNSVTGLTSLLASWPAATGSYSGYNLYFRKNPNEPFGSNKVVLDQDTTSFLITGLEIQQNYQITVKARYSNPDNEANGISVMSEVGPDSFLSENTLPSNPIFSGCTNLTAQVNTVKITCNKPRGAYNRLKFYVRKQNQMYSETVNSVAIVQDSDKNETVTHTVYDLDIDEKYCFFAKASYSLSPNDKSSSDVLISENTQESEICGEIGATPPVFPGILSLENTESLDSDSASIKVVLGEVEGDFSYYDIFLEENVSNPTVNILRIDPNGIKLTGTAEFEICNDVRGLCLILRGLNLQTTYAIKSRAIYDNLYYAADVTIDDTLQPISIETESYANHYFPVSGGFNLSFTS